MIPATTSARYTRASYQPEPSEDCVVVGETPKRGKHRTMLTEDDVVEAVCQYLTRHGCAITRRASTKEKGPDIVVARENSDGTLYVEAKGETSNDPSSARFGKRFNSAQVRDHVANALYTAAAALDPKLGRRRAAIALPDTQLHRQYVTGIQHALATLQIALFWVDGHQNVEVVSSWEP